MIYQGEVMSELHKTDSETDFIESLGASGRPVAIITGAACRVGRAISLKLADADYDLLLTYFNSVSEIQLLEKELVGRDINVVTQRVDFNNPSDAQKWARGVAQRLPRLDALVHNAAIYYSTSLDDIDCETVEHFLRINAVSPLLISAVFSAILKKNRGAIVALTDIHADGFPRVNYIAYAMSKAALTGMVRGLARDLAPEVRVNAVAPGVIAWPENGPDSSEEIQEQYLRRVLLQRAGTPEEAADLVLFLLHGAKYITGQIINLDGGRSLM